MASKEKKVSYTNINTYSVLNSRSENTENIWMACHGLGYLSKYFISYFDELPSDHNYIIAPQAPSKYYQDKKFKYVGASWLTKENTETEIENVLRYMDAVSDAENVRQEEDKLIVLGFSQGVSVALRWVAKTKIHCKSIVLYSGGIPKELTAKDFDFLKTETKVYLIYGLQDPYLTVERREYEHERAKELFGARLEVISFEGAHEVKKEILLRVL